MDADPLIIVLTVTSVAFISSTLTALVGAGGGTGLLLVMLWFVPAASVVPVHGCIQLVSNTARVVLFRRHMHWPAIIRFVIPMPAGVYVGLQLHGMMSQAALQLVIAGFVLLSLADRRLGVIHEQLRLFLRVARVLVLEPFRNELELEILFGRLAIMHHDGLHKAEQAYSSYRGLQLRPSRRLLQLEHVDLLHVLR